MAKKKLNKKVAAIGSIFVALIAVGAILYILYKMQGPQKFIEDGDTAVAAKNYEVALKAYARAYSRAKDNETRKKVLFKLADVHILNDDWRKALGCWDNISTIDTADKISRTKMLDFFYDAADNGQYSAWKRVLTTADELLAISPEARLYRIKGRASLELAKGGEVANREQALNGVIDVLQKARDLDVNNPLIYRYLAQAVLEKGDVLASKGSLDEKAKAQTQAKKWLEKAIAIAPEDPNTYIMLINMKRLDVKDRKQLDALESNYIALTKKFPKSPDVFLTLALYYKQDPNDIDKAVNAIQKSVELDPQTVKYSINAADIYYEKGSVANDQGYIQKAIETAKHALTLPGTKDTQSARGYANKMNKLTLYTFLAHRYIEEIVNLPASAPKQQKDALVADTEGAVHEISQIWGSGENPYVIEADGMLAYAKGDTMEGIKKMYTAYEQLKQSDAQNQDVQLAQLSYMLAKAFANSSEIGATRDFLYNALSRYIFLTHPETLLTYARVNLQLRDYTAVLNALDSYERFFQPNSLSRLLRASAYIGAGQLDDAQSLLSKLKSDDPNVIAVKVSLLKKRIEQAAIAGADANQSTTEGGPIQAEIEKYRDEQTKLAQKLLELEPNTTEIIGIVCENYIAKNKYQEAKALINNASIRLPNEPLVGFYKLLLAEPDPGKVTAQRRKDLAEQAIATIPDPVLRSLSLANVYTSKEQFDKAIAEYKKILDKNPADKRAINGMFDTAMRKNDVGLAEQFAAIASRENVDACGGQFFMARAAIAKKDYKDALSRLNAVLKEQPVFSQAYLLRSTVYVALQNDQLAIEDARKAATINPLSGLAAKQLASVLYQRDRKLGQKASAEQVTETRASLERAIVLNPQEWQLLSFYAEYISDTDASRALAILQRLQKFVPNVQNATLLGNLATKIAFEQKDPAQKKAMLDIAATAYEQGYKIEPNNDTLLRSYAQFYSKTDQSSQADQLLRKASNRTLLWQHQLQTGQFLQARDVLEKFYKDNPKDVNTLKGLLLVAERTSDAQAVTKYSQELLSFQDTPENQLGQITASLQVGLIEQAQKELASFKEKHADDNRYVILEALLLTRKGQFSDALSLLNKILERDQSNATAWHLRGQVYYARGDYDKAIDDFKKAKTITPTTRIRTDLARAYLRAGRSDDAINELSYAVETEPSDVETYYMLENVYKLTGKTDSLTRFYANTIKQFPDSPIWYNRAAIFALSQKNFDDAFAFSKTALELSQKANSTLSKEDLLTEARTAFETYLNVLRLKKQYDQLITYASQYVDSDLAVVAFTGMADAKAELGDKSAAFDYYTKALLKGSSEDVVVFAILRKMSFAVGSDETIAWCTRQLKTMPDSLPINLAMCNMMRMNNENNKALAYIDKCLQLVDKKSAAHRNFIDLKQMILIQAYNSTSDKQYLDAAIKLYEGIIAQSTSPEVGTMNNLAFLLADNNRDLDKAAEYIKKAYDVVQNSPNILDTYAYVMYKKGDYTKALELAQSAIQMSEQKRNVSASADAYEHMGMISEKVGHKNEAVNAYKQALKVGDKTLSEQAKERIKKAIEALK
jgi:tetratricopeptide (TPR) repeat protein